jgi:hypothetical protein
LNAIWLFEKEFELCANHFSITFLNVFGCVVCIHVSANPAYLIVPTGLVSVTT